MWKSSSLLAAVFLLAASSAWAGTVAFTADAVQNHPRMGAQSGRLAVSEKGIRFESVQQGRQTIQIVLPAEGVTRVLYPRDRVFMEWKGAPDMTPAGARPDTPCPKTPQGAPKITCKEDGTDKISGIDTRKWTLTRAGTPGSILIWWDPTRKMALRQESHDGRVMMLNLQGEIDYESRKVEQWESTMTSPNGQMQKAMQLFDPELGISVNEVHPNGMMRGLSNIKIGEPDPTLFEVPKDYRKIDPPQQRGQQQAVPGGAQ